MKYNTYWGETHHNTYQRKTQEPSLASVLEFAKSYLDFYTGAYYTPCGFRLPLTESCNVAFDHRGHPCEDSATQVVWHGSGAEDTKDAERIAREWKEVEAAVAGVNEPGTFVAFPGYEWQGDGTCGDHNVVYFEEGHPVHTPATLAELYDQLRSLKAIAIPHHTGYKPGIRAPRWQNCDPAISPVAELFSIHGCSETDEEWVGLRKNSHMGPGVAGGTYQDALNQGLHIGAICSTDNWGDMPARWGQGCCGCLATELTREGIWEAFQARRVYGVTGDRILLDFACNGEPMGSVLPAVDRREIQISVRGCDAIDRIELLRNGRVIATHCHQGTWDMPTPGTKSKFKVRVEVGWGPRISEIPFAEHEWHGDIEIAGGKVLGWNPCWTCRDQQVPQIRGNKATIDLVSEQQLVADPFQVGEVFEIEAEPAAMLNLQLNGLTLSEPISALAEGSHLLWYEDEVRRLYQEKLGVDSRTLARQDPVIYHIAFKAKVHKVIPEAGYCATLKVTDSEALDGKINYRVRVEQRNGQRAWSSPIWIRRRNVLR